MSWSRFACRPLPSLFALGLLVTSCAGPQYPPQPHVVELARLLGEEIERELEVHEIPALSLALVDDQEIVWAEGFGLARGHAHEGDEAGREVPATASTIYRVGSVSKILTGMAFLRLAEKGLVDLDKPVREYLPDFRPANETSTPITPRHLMAHRSGLVRESPVGHYFDATSPSLEATVDSLNGTPLVYPPGSRQKYSNAAVAVLGRIVEKVTGEPFEDHVRENLLEPMGMTTADFAEPARSSRKARGFMWAYDREPYPAPEFLLGTGPAGNLHASMVDLAHLARFILAGGRADETRLLQEETLAKMAEPQFSTASRTGRFGLSFSLGNLDGHATLGHGGAVYGFSTSFLVIPELKLGVAVSASLDVSNAVVERIARRALRGLIASREGESLEPIDHPVPIDPVLARELHGQYGQVFQLSNREGRLYLDGGTFQMEVRTRGDELVTEDRHAHERPLGLTADRDALVLAGREHPRQPEALPPACLLNWKEYIGEYGWDHNVLYILEKNGALHALVEWIFSYPLVEKSPGVFDFPGYGLYHGEQVIFRRDTSGKVVEVEMAGVRFPRREVGTEEGETFKIEPLDTEENLRRRALEASPPRESGEFRPADLVDLRSLDPTIQYDIRYASDNNFMGMVFYQKPRAYLQRPAAEAVVRVHREMKEKGYGLLIHDAYRPWFVTKMFWDATPDSMKGFVANPARGSRHNRGCAVDLTLYDLKTGEPVQMSGGYDEFTERSYPYYPGGTSRQRWLRALLRNAMNDAGFTIYELEWWHFDYRDWEKYRVNNFTFEELESSKVSPSRS